MRVRVRPYYVPPSGRRIVLEDVEWVIDVETRRELAEKLNDLFWDAVLAVHDRGVNLMGTVIGLETTPPKKKLLRMLPR
ncbi:MAG: hypothetical protein DRJ67_05230 [Thermoprotei archaeon]|nr:MAG: hypothetical protein DRJ67_05230 [Thermoprotei archaeon]